MYLSLWCPRCPPSVLQCQYQSRQPWWKEKTDDDWKAKDNSDFDYDYDYMFCESVSDCVITMPLCRRINIISLMQQERSLSNCTCWHSLLHWTTALQNNSQVTMHILTVLVLDILKALKALWQPLASNAKHSTLSEVVVTQPAWEPIEHVHTGPLTHWPININITLLYCTSAILWKTTFVGL